MTPCQPGWVPLLAVSLLLVSVPLVGAVGGMTEATPQILLVGPGGTHASLEAALEEAAPGATIRVNGGVHQGGLVATRPVHLIGEHAPTILGGGNGTVVTLRAPNSTLEGFSIHGSGDRHDLGDAGIKVQGSGTEIVGNHLTGVLFGIWIEQANDVTVRANTIEGKDDLELPRRGDGIRTWYSRNVTLANNEITGARDTVLWYSEDVTIKENRVTQGRYGIHMMYSHGARIHDNVLEHNAVGAYIMYTRDVVLERNRVQENRGASGYGLAFKEADDVRVAENLVAGNEVGLFLDTTPFTPAGHAHILDNGLAYNDVGAQLLPSVKGARITGNTFLENLAQVSVHGDGSLEQNTWSANHWSDYAGYDLDGDGYGEVAYHAQRLFEALTQREPMLQALAFSPTVETLELAARAFPIIQPRPMLTDDQPRVDPAPPPVELAAQAGSGGWLLGLGIAVASASVVLLSLPRLARARLEPPAPHRDQPPNRSTSEVLLDVRGLGKRFGETAALREVAFTGRAGEVLALWGTNGAGKTTLIRAILGLVRYDGEAAVDGHEVTQAGKAARARIGYVPQRVALPDWPVDVVLDHFASLRGLSSRRAHQLAGQLGLGDHLGKKVTALSGGLLQRLALALALLPDPPVLVLDEPTANLDAVARHDYLATLAELRDEGKLIVISSHRLDEVETLADRVLILESGRLVAETSGTGLRAALGLQAESHISVPEEHTEGALAAMQAEGLEPAIQAPGTLAFQADPNDRRLALAALERGGIPVIDLKEMCSTWS